MKRILLALCAIVPFCASAQYNPEIMEADLSSGTLRQEIVLPKKVDGYNIYKADLHVHTIYSDGAMTPAYRIEEAYWDGLDIIAITDHLEYRRIEANALKFLRGYTGGEPLKAENNNVIKTPATERGILVDLNYAVKEAQSAADKFGILVIPAIEITREPVQIGHYNALFTTDNNTIYDPDPAQALRNARKQGALIMHNHPGWKRTSCDKTEFEQQIYKEGLIDGIEVVNGRQIYPKVVSRAKEDNIFVASTTDIHCPTAWIYDRVGHLRNMTFILAEDCTLESIREALKARRTLAYSAGYLLGDEELLLEFFHASISYRVVHFDKRKGYTLEFRNNTSLPFQISRGKGVTHTIKPFHTIRQTVGPKTSVAKFDVRSMLYGAGKHPTVEIPIQ